MNPNREEALFAAALEQPPTHRAAFLNGACLGDAALRARVEELLASHEATANPLQTAANLAPTLKLDLAELPDEAVGQTLGRYKLLEKVGEGGCGVVYVAEQTEPVRRRVALKVIKLGMDTKQVVARFEAERQALAMMDHPNIAKVLDAGTTEQGRPYFVMELVRGIRITDYCDQANLSTQERLDLFIKVCQAIQHAHQKGIIHRDIKPSNILVTLHDGVPVPKVIDFGIAKATEGRLTDNTVYTQLHQFIGTPAYMSPEQAEMSGLDIDTRSDIYSLGVLLYELLSGSTPFDAKELMAAGLDAMRKTIREREPQRPSTRLATLGADQLTTTAKRRSADTSKLLHQLKGDLDWIVMKCLEKDRQRRYDTANGLAADIKRHLDNEPVVARPPSAAYKFQKAFRRNKLVFTAGAIVGVALLLGVGISSWQAIVASRARQQEAKANDRLRAQIQETEQARQTAEKAALAESQQRARAEELLQAVQFQKAEDLLSTGPSVSGLTLLGQMLRANPSNAVVAARFASALLVADRPPLFEPLRHGSNVNYAEFSPDGQRVVTASDDQTARVWDARSGQPLTAPLRHEGKVSSAVFSPDGQRVVTASRDQTARVWDARSGQAITAPLRHEDVVLSARFSPDGQRVVTASQDKTARVWDARSGQLVTEPLRHENSVFSAWFSPDGQRVVTASWDKTAQVWDARSGQPLAEALRHEGGVLSAQFSPDGQRVVTASEDKTARVWDARSGQPLAEPLRHEDGVSSAQFSPDGQRVVTASRDGAARVWDARSGQPLTEPLRHGDGVHSAQFSPDGQRVATASDDKTARVWDAHSGQPLTEPLRHEGIVISAQFSPDGQRVVTASEDKTARVWEVPVPPVPAPAWFLDWAEARIGRRFDPKSTAGAVPLAELRRQQDLAAARTEADFYTRLAHWAQADPSTRTLSPQAKLMVPDYLQQRIQENTLAGLREAIRIAPTNALAWARLALVEMVQDAQLHPGRWDEAAFSARQALRWDPQNGEAWHAQAAVEQGTGQADQAMISLEKSLQLDPVNRGAWELKGRLLTLSGRPAEALAAYRNPLAALPTDPMAAFQARTELLQKHLATLAQSHRPQETEAVQREIVRWMVEEVLIHSRRLPATGLGEFLNPLQTLAASCHEAGYAAAGEQLRARLDESRRLSAVAQPGNLGPALRIASLDAWLGREREYAATCASLVDFARDTKDPNLAERTAKICSLLPTDDRTRETALGLARRAVELGKGNPRFGLMQLALGMAAYRSGHWREAEQVLAAAPASGQPNPNPNVVIPAACFRAMALFRQDKQSEARQLLAETAAKMTPLPADPKDPLAGGIDDAVLVHWLAYREAAALIGFEGSPAPAVKP